MFQDFVSAALPWVVLGIALAVAAVFSQNGRNHK